VSESESGGAIFCIVQDKVHPVRLESFRVLSHFPCMTTTVVSLLRVNASKPGNNVGGAERKRQGPLACGLDRHKSHASYKNAIKTNIRVLMANRRKQSGSKLDCTHHSLGIGPRKTKPSLRLDLMRHSSAEQRVNCEQLRRSWLRHVDVRRRAKQQWERVGVSLSTAEATIASYTSLDKTLSAAPEILRERQQRHLAFKIPYGLPIVYAILACFRLRLHLVNHASLQSRFLWGRRE
jgi:hypothetical protein